MLKYLINRIHERYNLRPVRLVDLDLSRTFYLVKIGSPDLHFKNKRIPKPCRRIRYRRLEHGIIYCSVFDPYIAGLRSISIEAFANQGEPNFSGRLPNEMFFVKDSDKEEKLTE
jgi:hypothetical protein